MTRKRLRDLPDMKKVYVAPHDHRRFGDGHHLRVETTIVLAKWAVAKYGANSVGDLSCGNAAIPKALGLKNMVLGDFAPGYQYVGLMEETLVQIPRVDLFVCSETLEHLNDPDTVLRQIRNKASTLVVSTPIDCWEDTNGEHLWAWSREDIEVMAARAAWKVEMFASVDSRVMGAPYQYGIWVFR